MSVTQPHSKKKKKKKTAGEVEGEGERDIYFNRNAVIEIV